MSADPVAPLPYDGFALPSWATPCESAELCEVDGLPIVATMQAKVNPIAPRGKRPNSTSHEFKLCPVCLAFERYNRGECDYKEAEGVAERLQAERVQVEQKATHVNRPYRKREGK